MADKDLKILETERLILRPWTRKDAPALYELAKNPNVGPHAGWKPHGSEEESLEIIETIFFPGAARAVCKKSENGNASAKEEIIGCIGLEPDSMRPSVKSRELGYWLGEAYWGRGFMTEAAKRVIDFAFLELELDILSVHTGPLNKRSQRIIEKCGFVYEGTLRKAYRIFDGTNRDVLCYSILWAEWIDRRQVFNKASQIQA